MGIQSMSPMESNIEEAIRAREMAERKMQMNDFSGALKVALRAQKIYPQLENITQLLAVCDVHHAFEQKIASDELDWYGILQVGQTVDNSMVKKQYRKLALLLHPDKNKYYGAEAAFKLVGEAQRVLSDPIKRQMHDTKRRAALGTKSVCTLQQKTRKSFIGKQHISESVTRSPMMPRSTSKSPHQEFQQSTRARSSSKLDSITAKCPYCKMTHQFSIPFMEKVMCCHSCKKPFVSRETGKQTNIRGDLSADPQHAVPSQTASASGMKPLGDVYGENMNPNISYNAHLVKSHGRNCRNRGSNKMNDKRKRSEIDESCESLFVGSREDAIGKSLSSNDKEGFGQNVCCVNDQRSSKHDTNQKKTNPLGKKVQEICKSFPLKENGTTVESLSTSKVECYDCHDMSQNYNDFDKIRDIKGFIAGQVWALFHPFDTMPRFYVIVKAVYRAKFKLRVVWLEPDPDDEIGVEIGNCNFPRSWGKFVEGTSDMMHNLFTFSHQMIWENGGRKNKYKIYPRKGDVWAIFKNWNIGGDSESVTKAACKFELVEVASGFVEGLGVSVVYLGKVKGFASIFCPVVKDEGKTSFQIPPKEMSRFSHKIPSFQMVEEENKGIPKGSFELDPAAIPLELM